MLETVQLFRAKVVDVAPDAVTIEATGNADKLEALLRVLEPFGIRSSCSPAWSRSAAAPARSPTAPLRPLDRSPPEPTAA